MSRPDGDTPAQPRHSPAILLLSDIGDTTWRMFVPTIGLMLLGIWVDQQIGSKPWLMVVGLVVGTVLAVILIKRQLKKIQRKS